MAEFLRHTLLASILMVLCICLPAYGQTGSVTVLTSISSSEDGGTVTLTFTSGVPRYSLVADGTDKPALILALTSAGSGLQGLTSQHGSLRSVSFTQEDTMLTLHFTSSSAINLSVAPSGQRLLLHVSKTGLPQSVDVGTGLVAGEAGAQTAMPTQSFRSPGQDGFEVVRLNYADVSEVVGLLTDGQTVKANDSFDPHEPAFGSAGLGGSAPVATQPVTLSTSEDPMAQSVNDVIAVDRRLNAIILKGNPERIAELKRKIAQIDIPVETVLLETMFVELDMTGAKNVGIDFNNASGQIGAATLVTGAFIPSGFDVNKPLTSASVQAAIYAQVQSGRGRIVSKPRISALSGSSAKIITGDAIPILTSIALSGVNGVSQQVQYVNVGVSLEIAPRVTADGNVNSHIFCMVSSVTGYDPRGYPRISQREAQTSATVHDGDTYVIGGLTEDNSSEGKSKVPLLGDIPGLGQIFGTNQSSENKTDLYIVVTPHIVHRGDPLASEVVEALRKTRLE